MSMNNTIRDNIRHLYAPNLLAICIDRSEDGDYAGNAWDQYHTDPTPFANMMELIRHIEKFFDELDFPQRSTVPRSFSEDQSAPVRIPLHRRAERVKVMDNLEDKRGNQGTFIVQIKYRQNATWQGQVVWAEKNRKMYFRSALELLHLIDTAMSEDNPESAADPEQVSDQNKKD